MMLVCSPYISAGWTITGGTREKGPPQWHYTFLETPHCKLQAILSWGWIAIQPNHEPTDEVEAAIWLGNFIDGGNGGEWFGLNLTDEQALAILKADPWEFFYDHIHDFAYFL